MVCWSFGISQSYMSAEIMQTQPAESLEMRAEFRIWKILTFKKILPLRLQKKAWKSKGNTWWNISSLGEVKGAEQICQ